MNEISVVRNPRRLLKVISLLMVTSVLIMGCRSQVEKQIEEMGAAAIAGDLDKLSLYFYEDLTESELEGLAEEFRHTFLQAARRDFVLMQEPLKSESARPKAPADGKLLLELRNQDVVLVEFGLRCGENENFFEGHYGCRFSKPKFQVLKDVSFHQGQLVLAAIGDRFHDAGILLDSYNVDVNKSLYSGGPSACSAAKSRNSLALQSRLLCRR